VAELAETYGTDGPECPYCGHQHSDTEPAFYDERLTELECDGCSQAFDVLVYTSTSWTCTARPSLSPEQST
jgi:transcription elongation factor Elf1